MEIVTQKPMFPQIYPNSYNNYKPKKRKLPQKRKMSYNFDSRPNYFNDRFNTSVFDGLNMQYNPNKKSSQAPYNFDHLPIWNFNSKLNDYIPDKTDEKYNKNIGKGWVLCDLKNDDNTNGSEVNPSRPKQTSWIELPEQGSFETSKKNLAVTEDPTAVDKMKNSKADAKEEIVASSNAMPLNDPNLKATSPINTIQESSEHVSKVMETPENDKISAEKVPKPVSYVHKKFRHRHADFESTNNNSTNNTNTKTDTMIKLFVINHVELLSRDYLPSRYRLSLRSKIQEELLAKPVDKNIELWIQKSLEDGNDGNGKANDAAKSENKKKSILKIPVVPNFEKDNSATKEDGTTETKTPVVPPRSPITKNIFKKSNNPENLISTQIEPAKKLISVVFEPDAFRSKSSKKQKEILNSNEIKPADRMEKEVVNMENIPIYKIDERSDHSADCQSMPSICKSLEIIPEIKLGRKGLKTNPLFNESLEIKNENSGEDSSEENEVNDVKSQNGKLICSPKKQATTLMKLRSRNKNKNKDQNKIESSWLQISPTNFDEIPSATIEKIEVSGSTSREVSSKDEPENDPCDSNHQSGVSSDNRSFSGELKIISTDFEDEDEKESVESDGSDYQTPHKTKKDHGAKVTKKVPIKKQKLCDIPPYMLMERAIRPRNCKRKVERYVENSDSES